MCCLFALQNQRFLKSKCFEDARRRKIAFNHQGDLKMIGEKLRELGEYIEKIDEIKPIELLEINMKSSLKKIRRNHQKDTHKGHLLLKWSSFLLEQNQRAMKSLTN